MVSAIDLGQLFLTPTIPGEVWSSLIVMLIIAILAIIIGIQAKHQDPLKKPKGLLLIAIIGVQFFDKFVEGLIGTRIKWMGGFVMGIATYVFISFIFSLCGLPSPMTYMAVPLSLGLITFVLIHETSAKYTGLKYFKRYVDPIPIFLPINLISMWAPLLSLTLRMFGNAIAGFVLMTIISWGIDSLAGIIIPFMGSVGGWNVGSIILNPIITAPFHAYFDLFSGFIQTVVFISLSTIFIGQELPEEIDVKISEKGDVI
ncbi:MAG: F0F1 ATP synthase subunit A [Bacilli bacterium]|nr:F0F1 ATP synthase subunit A [Bacilli bacterium]